MRRFICGILAGALLLFGGVRPGHTKPDFHEHPGGPVPHAFGEHHEFAGHPEFRPHHHFGAHVFIGPDVWGDPFLL